MRSLIDHYAQTGDARYATSEHHITMLHLAALCREEELVKELLTKGANPNAIMLPLSANAMHETPLTFAFNAQYSQGLQPKEALAVLEALLGAGAQVIPSAAPCSDAFAGCCKLFLCDAHRQQGLGDEVALKLLQAGATGGLAEAEACVEKGWIETLAHLVPTLPDEARAKLRGSWSLWMLCKGCLTPRGLTYHTERPRAQAAVDCAAAVLQGSSIAGQPDHTAWECMTTLSGWLAQESTAGLEFDRKPAAHFIALLLQHGADAYVPLDRHNRPLRAGSNQIPVAACAADYLACEPTVRASLEETGLLPPPPVHRLAKETMAQQLLDIPTAAFSPEELREQFEALCRFISAQDSPSPTNVPQQRYASAKALALMVRADRTRAQEWVQAQPLWHELAAWEGEALAARNLLYALQKTPGFGLPADWLLQRARAMDAANRPDISHAFARLLEHDRSPETAAIIEQLCTEGTPAPLRAAALTCKLHHGGLPALGESEVRHWLMLRHNMSSGVGHYVHNRAVMAECSADNLPDDGEGFAAESDEHSFFRKSRRANELHPERLHFEGSRSSHKANTIRELKKIGAASAAAWYEKGEGNPASASLDLEIALALYLLKYEKEFLNPGISSFFIIDP